MEPSGWLPYSRITVVCVASAVRGDSRTLAPPMPTSNRATRPARTNLALVIPNLQACKQPCCPALRRAMLSEQAGHAGYIADNIDETICWVRADVITVR